MASDFPVDDPQRSPEEVMALTARTRTALARGLTELMHDEEAAAEVVDQFPDRDAPEPATREHVDAQFAEVAARFEVIDHRFDAIDHRFEAIDQRFAAIDQRFAAVDARFDTMEARFDSVKAELRGEIASSSAELHTHLAAMEGRLLTGVHSELQTMVRWSVGALVSMGAVFVGVAIAMRP